MNGASKILTVSYGTFSCTLEGFDEPFNTMKAIAEYFRDLAADDRYFGAEPPIPDAAMLHKIAEREIQRRVEAKVSDNGVLLRADDAPMPRVTMPAAPTLSPEAAPSVESAAARLSRLRAAQTQILAPAPALGDISSRFADVEAYAEDQDSVAAPVPETVLVQPVEPVEAIAEIVAEAPLPVAEPVVAEPIGETLAVEPETLVIIEDLAIEDLAIEDLAAPEPEALAELTAEPTPEPEPILAAVADAVIPHDPIAEPDLIAEDIASEDSDAFDAADLTTADMPVDAFPEAEAIEAPTEDVLASLRETLAGLMVQDDQLAADMAAAEDAAPDVLAPDVLADDSLIAGLMTREDPLPEDQASAFDDQPTEAEFEAEAAYEADPADLADLARMDGVSADDYADVAMVADLPEPIEAAEAAALPEPAETTAEAEVDLQPQAPVVAEKLQRARARVIKIRRLDKKPEVDPLTPEAEADLQNTLAALEAEIAPAAAIETDSIEAELDAALSAPQPDATPVDKPDTKIAATDDAAVDRLIAQTNTQLEVPEVKRRRSAIAHLKAAVLATVADRRQNPNAASKGTEVKMDPYRKDLDQAVRPIAATDRPAPLVLVSEQRIDRKRDAAADALRPVPQIVPSVAAPQPVRPRRVTTGGLSHAMSAQPSDDLDGDLLTPAAMENIFAGGDKQSFADFAESLGADSLAELIEAAGAYCTLVLDRPSFSRPLLFQQMSSLPHLAEMSREDGLRGFGKLLRDGRIQKTERGQFALSTTSPILTEAKRIAS